MLIVLLFMPLLASKIQLFRGRSQRGYRYIFQFCSRLQYESVACYRRQIRPNRDVCRERTVCQGYWWGCGGIGQREEDDHRSDSRVMVPRQSLFVSGQPACLVQNSCRNCHQSLCRAHKADDTLDLPTPFSSHMAQAIEWMCAHFLLCINHRVCSVSVYACLICRSMFCYLL